MQNFKNNRSSDCYLKLDSMKPESLVIAYHHEAVNTLMLSYTQPVRRRKHAGDNYSDDIKSWSSLYFVEVLMTLINIFTFSGQLFNL